jgi:hypothetical protein
MVFTDPYIETAYYAIAVIGASGIVGWVITKIIMVVQDRKMRSGRH